MNFQSSTSRCPAFPSTVCRWSCLFSSVCFWHLQRQLAEYAVLILGTVFYLTDLSICSCTSIGPFLTIAQRGVLKPGTMTLQLYPFHPRLFGPLCFRINLRIFFLVLWSMSLLFQWRLHCLCECFLWWESFNKRSFQSVNMDGPSTFQYPPTSLFCFLLSCVIFTEEFFHIIS